MVMYKWQRKLEFDGVENVVLDDRVTLTEGNLTFSLTQRNDTGVYICVAENEHGGIMADAKLTVLGEWPVSCRGEGLLVEEADTLSCNHIRITIYGLGGWSLLS